MILQCVESAYILERGEVVESDDAAVGVNDEWKVRRNGKPFFGHAVHADPLDGWRCCSQKRVMSRPIHVRQL